MLIRNGDVSWQMMRSLISVLSDISYGNCLLKRKWLKKQASKYCVFWTFNKHKVCKVQRIEMDSTVNASTFTVSFVLVLYFVCNYSFYFYFIRPSLTYYLGPISYIHTDFCINRSSLTVMIYTNYYNNHGHYIWYWWVLFDSQCQR